MPWAVTWWPRKDGYGREHTFSWLGRLVQDQRLFSLSLAYVYRSRQGFYVSLSVPSGAQIPGNGALRSQLKLGQATAAGHVGSLRGKPNQSTSGVWVVCACSVCSVVYPVLCPLVACREVGFAACCALGTAVAVTPGISTTANRRFVAVLCSSTRAAAVCDPRLKNKRVFISSTAKLLQDVFRLVLAKLENEVMTAHA